MASDDKPMTDKPAANEPVPNQLFQWWWLHDARWYQEVAARFGFEAANEINAKALKFVSARVARSVAQGLGKPVDELEWLDVVDAFARCPTLMWPPELVDFDCEPTGPGEFVVHSRRNFALSMLRRAGTLEHYQCPCLRMREGWFEGLGLRPVENRVEQCMREGASCCTFVARVDGYGAEEPDGAERDPEEPAADAR
ncbi:L-2-amino-thiazoline-4-carboxylic acid hydrolase [Micromonospora sp. KC721]|uniref:L-2-amino-thiazoline-4-carboxylic acid hydrolase n=1 Tax=Micromonospora sp. KC721 TaxID=2530380 RepID=UPI001050E463|nr:L-2-amino-thiazoline-4-carboxylic acid hydrolase [Micromonospora sp. KC721]TDB81872.1 hypothetical protein E1182_03495 [Micromonospora sp. KC721]